MPQLDPITVGSGIDNTELFRGMDSGLIRIERFANDAQTKVGNIKGPEFKPADMPTLPAPASMETPNLPAPIDPAMFVGSLRSALKAGLAPINEFAAEFSKKFDVVGRSIVNAIAKADDRLRFPRFIAGIDRAKKYLGDGFTSMEGRVGKFARFVDGSLTFAKIGLNFDHTIRQMKSSLTGKWPSLENVAGKSIKPIDSAARKATDSFKGLALQAGIALGVFGLAYKSVEFLKGGIKQASDLNETIGKTDDVLGPASASVKAYADDMARQFGMVKQETLDLASGFGGIGKGLGGLGGKELADFSKQFTTLAADFSSFANVDVKEAGVALRAVLTGNESDLLKQYGVVISEDTAKQQAYARGIAKAGTELTTQQKLTIRSKLLMEQLGDAQGNLAKTAGGSANQQRELSGSITNLQTSIGSALLPAFDAGLAVVNKFATSLGSMVERNMPAIEGFSAMMANGFARLGQAAEYIWPEIQGIGMAIVGAFDSGGSAVLGFLPSFDSLATGAKELVGSVRVFITDAIETVKKFPASIAIAFGADPAKSVTDFADGVKRFVGDAFGTVGFVLRNFGDIAQFTFLSLMEPIDGFVANVELIPNHLGKIADYIGGNWLELMLYPFNKLADAVSLVWDTITKFAANPSKGIQIDIGKLFDTDKSLAAKLPEFETAKTPDYSAAKQAIGDRIAARETDFAKGMGKPLDSSATVVPAKPQAPSGVGAGLVARPPEFDKEGAKQLDTFVKDLKKDVKTPFEKFDEGLAKARDAFGKGLISAEEFKRAPKAIAKDAGLAGETKLAGATDINSQEAYSSLASAFSGKTSGMDGIERVGREQLTETRGLRRDVRDWTQKVGKSLDVSTASMA